MTARFFSLFLIGTIAASATQAFANNHLTEGVLIGEAIELLDSTRVACSGISDELSHISGISVANTAVSGVGTVAAGGALVAGVKKKQNRQRSCGNIGTNVRTWLLRSGRTEKYVGQRVCSSCYGPTGTSHWTDICR